MPSLTDPGPSSSENWLAARAQMLLDPAVANLNTGSFGPTPRPVFERAMTLRRRLAEEPMDFFLRQAPPLLWQARTRLAEFLHTDPLRLIFTANVSASINLVAASLSLSAPGEVLLTDHEYGSMYWTWERHARRQGLHLRTFPLPTLASDPDEVVAAFAAALSDQTRVLFFSHVLSPTGMVLPALRICAEARRRGVITVIDGAHAPGLLPLDLTAIGADFYAGNGHKWLLAPIGTGFLVFAPGRGEILQPLQVSWGWQPAPGSPDQPDEWGTTPRLRRLEFEGTRDICPWLCVPEAIDFQSNLGWEAIRARCQALARRARACLTDLGLPAATPDHPELWARMTAVELPRERSAENWRQILWERYRLEVGLTERPERLLLRISTNFYNTEDEVERLAGALTDLC